MSESKCNPLFQIEMSDLTKDVIAGGDFDTWLPGTPNYPQGWTIVQVAGSTVTEETTNLSPGATGGSAARFNYDAISSDARIFQIVDLLKESFYRLSFWVYCSDPDGVKTFGIRIRDNSASVYLQNNGTWDSTPNDIPVEVSSGWYNFKFDLLTHPDYTSYFIGIGNGNTILSNHVIVDDLKLNFNTTAVSKEVTAVNGLQYREGIGDNKVSFTDTYAKDGKLIANSNSIKILDPITIWGGQETRRFRDMIEAKRIDNEVINGARVIARDYLGNILQRYRITNYTLNNDSVSLELSNFYGELSFRQALNLEIKEEVFPDAPVDSIGQPINFFIGQFLVDDAGVDKGARNYIEALRTKPTESGNPSRYIIGKSPGSIQAFDLTKDFQFVVDDTGNEITPALCSLVLPTGTEGAEQYHYIDIDSTLGDLKYVRVHFKFEATSAQALIESIGDSLFKVTPFDTSLIDGVLASRNYNKFSGGFQDRTDPRILITQSTKFTDILSKICKTFNFSYTVSPEGKILFQYTDLNEVHNYGPQGVIELSDENALTIAIKEHRNPQDELKNQFNTLWANDKKRRVFENIESQINNGVVNSETINADLLTNNYAVARRHAWFTARDRGTGKHFPRGNYKALIPKIFSKLSGYGVTISELLKPFRVFKFRHPTIPGNDFRYMRALSITRNFPDLTADVLFEDVTDMIRLDTNAALLLQSNGDQGDRIIYDSAVTGYNIIDTGGGSVINDTTVKLNSKSVLTNTDSTPSIVIAPFGFRERLDPFPPLVSLGSVGDYSYTISCWVRFRSLTGNQAFIGQYASPANYWAFYKNATNKISFILRAGGVNIFNITGTTTVSADKWYHVIFHNSFSGVGLYVECCQEAYNAPLGASYVFDATINAFNDGNSANYLDGYLQDVYFSANPANIANREKSRYNLNPNVSNTDTYTKPGGLISSFWDKYFKYKKINQI